jgi:hypothetical protein
MNINGMPRAVLFRQSISSSRAVSVVLIGTWSSPPLAGRLQRTLPGLGRTAEVQASS